MKTLIYVPVIHMSADLGSVAKQVDKKGIAGFGEEFWEKHRRTVSGFWDSVIKYFSNLEVEGFKVYQDGLVADGEVGQKIVEEGIKSGSKNYELIDSLMRKGAVLVQTEDFSLVKKERDRIVKLTEVRILSGKLIAYLQYRLTRNILLKKRDNYIARRILETLEHGETGILFIGAYHNIKNELSKSVRISETKNTEKVREYQRLLPFHSKNTERFKELSEYLVSEIN